MLISFNDLRQFTIEASDGRKGHTTDLYFDDDSWQIRYAVAESGFLFTKQQSLLKSTLMGEPSIEKQTLSVSLTKEQIDEADSPDAHPPVSEQRAREIRLSQLEYWPPLMIGAPGAVYTPAIAEHQLRTGEKVTDRKLEEELGELEDPHLRSLHEVSGYAIQATDGEIGSISDFLLDPDGWKIRYLVVDTGKWLPGRQVAIRPDWVSHISWDGQSIVVNVSKEEVSGAPELSQIDELERSDTHLALAPYGAYAGFGP
jgi:uncharacterized protein YrrD